MLFFILFSNLPTGRQAFHPGASVGIKSLPLGPKDSFGADMLTHSVRKDLTGLAIATFNAWKLIVNNAISRANNPATAKTHN
jgi:hypothetical protein